ncbi:hypothetical protein [Clostridium tagluense]|uniref:hypothetical protein n=1 Tax=Clostridium tagluense TaxID=360422 RepID=UPI001C0E389E|nr:hypothetical protein [Clostridium tagluense]MBU3129334.1 hypothetical protein [Clostridium tagluense]
MIYGLSYEDKFFDYMIFSSIHVDIDEFQKNLGFVKKYLKDDDEIFINNYNV